VQLTVDVQVACEAEHPADTQIIAWVREALQQADPERPEVELTVRLVEPSEITRLNREFRNKDGATNVLSFPFEPPAGIPIPLLGDIVICAQVVLQEAKEQGKQPESHWAHMVIHGVLHLLGYDHQTEPEAQRMESTEVEIMQRLGYANPYETTEARNNP
jgi:probable rRNA maturation factor